VRRNGLYADGTPLLPCRHREDLSDDRGFVLVDDQDLLVLVASSFRYLDLVAEGRRGAVPETLAGVLAQEPLDKLASCREAVLMAARMAGPSAGLVDMVTPLVFGG
jgi:hypothetical protein